MYTEKEKKMHEWPVLYKYVIYRYMGGKKSSDVLKKSAADVFNHYMLDTFFLILYTISVSETNIAL